MNEPKTPPGPRSTPLYRGVLVFVAGITLGALMMVEVVPASNVVELEGLGAISRLPDGSVVDNGGASESSPGDGGTEADGAGSGPIVAPGPARSSAPNASGDPGGSGDSDGNTSQGDDQTSGDPAPTSPGVKCEPGQNGGATDQGVTATEIQMATTVVESGIGSAFLGEVRHAMDAVLNRVNREGGICGRQLKVTYRDDAWSADTGAQFLRNFINQGIFAVPIGPSSEGLNLVIQSGDFDKAKIPVVGTNGLIITQYERADGSPQQWVFPVAAATVSSARIMAQDAYDRGARTFSVVFAHNYRFGQEGAEAFNAEVKRLTGTDIEGYEKGSTSCNLSYCAVTAGDGSSSYSQQVGQFQEAEFVALFLEPQTARAWMTDNNAPAASDSSIPFGFGAAQPLFTRKFGDQCGTKCHKMLVWTGFKPFQEHYVSDPDVQRYVSDLQTTNRNADPNNQFSLGAYIGMELLVEGIKAVGPELTREKLKQQLDTIVFDSGLTLADPMRFSADNRYVATKMQAWEIQAVGSFSGWSAQQIVADPRFGG